MKKFWLFVFGLIFLLTSHAVAQNKVVVIPLLSDSGDKIQTVTSAGRVWMDRNLGAFRVAQSEDDYQAYGWMYQWGRLADGHEMPHSPTTTTLSSGNVPGHGDFITTSLSPYDWRDEPNDDLWQGVSGTNNPCPAGFRLPTETEWETERASWSSNNSAGAFASPLKLVLAGNRDFSTGTVSQGGSYGWYWSSTVNGSYALILSFGGAHTIMGSSYRAFGLSVRCIKD